MRYIVILLALVAGAAWADKAPPLRAPHAAEAVAEGVHVIHGPMGVPSPENQGFINNPAFVVTDAGVVVIDPGGSVQVGEMVLEAIAKVTDRPVVAVFNTHVHGDHWLGNQAIAEAYPQARIYAHPRMIERVAKGAGEHWLEVMHDLTQGATAGTRVVAPQAAVDGGTDIPIGGVTFRVLHDGKAHTDNDIMLLLPERGVIFLGDNAGHGRMLRLNDGDIRGNIAALERALASGARVFVPGHGRSGGPEAASRYRDYLKTLYRGVEALFEEELADYEMKPRLLPKLAPWRHWVDFDSLVGSHISLAYLQVEADAF